jgi:hypothetical protein
MLPNTAPWRELQEFAQCQPSALAFRSLAALLDTCRTYSEKGIKAIDIRSLLIPFSCSLGEPQFMRTHSPCLTTLKKGSKR